MFEKKSLRYFTFLKKLLLPSIIFKYLLNTIVERNRDIILKGKFDIIL